ncbi:MAG: hypothetical protein NT077_01295 [Candidatus Taylorbacteria bacterium]|nr:hypothetical protein [Candidatus Taylorbacteria bacterium]
MQKSFKFTDRGNKVPHTDFGVLGKVIFVSEYLSAWRVHKDKGPTI